jgi:CBS domain-containing protein
MAGSRFRTTSRKAGTLINAEKVICCFLSQTKEEIAMRATEKIKQDREISTVGDIAATRASLTFYPEQFIKTIFSIMQHSRNACASVIDDDGNLIGMLTEREILRRIFVLISDSTINPVNIGKYLDDMTVRDMMITSPSVLDEDTDIEKALEIITQLGLRFMPVVSHYDPQKPIGLIDEREVAIHVKNRLDRIKREAAEKEAILYHLFHEPYGAGYNSQAQ